MTPTEQPVFTLEQLAQYVGCEFRGDPNIRITGVASLELASSENGIGDISFLEQASFRKFLTQTRAAAVILRPTDSANCSVGMLITDNPYLVYAKVAALFEKIPKIQSGIHSSTIVDPTAQIDPEASIAECCVIGAGVKIAAGVVIGAGSVIGERSSIGAYSVLRPRVVLYPEVVLGERVTIHSGAVLGCDGFGFARDKTHWHKIPQLGRVLIGNDVEIGANTTIDRGALTDTVIASGVKIDNLVQVAHGVVIDEDTIVAGCVGIAGGVRIGKRCMIAGGVGISGHLEITDDVVLTGMATVPYSLTEPGVYSSGTGIQKNRDWHRSIVRYGQLDTMAKRIMALEKKINVLEQGEKS